MSKTKIVILVVGLVLIALIPVLWHRGKARGQEVATLCWQIGRDLLAITNSTSLSSIQPTLQRRLAQFLSAPARVEAVRLGDEPRPATDLKATARLYLVNDRNERLGIRLQQEFRTDKFRVVGFWVPDSAPPAELP
jgi:hypothetical protein